MTTAKSLKHEQKSDLLIQKGIELLWSKGYNATSVNDIVKASGVPKGSFYFYFESKVDFVIKAIDQYFNAHFEPAREILENKSIRPKQRLLKFYSYRCDLLKNEMGCKKGCMACNLSSEMAEHNEAIRSAINQKSQLVLAMIAGVIQEAQNSGEILNPMEANNLASFIEDAGKGAMISMKEMNSSYPVDNFLNSIRYILLK